MREAASRSPRRWTGLLFVAFVAIALSEFGVPRIFGGDRAHFWFEDLPVWGSLYGLVSCVAIIVVSKLLGKAWLTRPEHYYDS
jgi:hypothetical protein